MASQDARMSKHAAVAKGRQGIDKRSGACAPRQPPARITFHEVFSKTAVPQHSGAELRRLVDQERSGRFLRAQHLAMCAQIIRGQGAAVLLFLSGVELGKTNGEQRMLHETTSSSTDWVLQHA
jgi:hypothetical protein